MKRPPKDQKEEAGLLRREASACTLPPGKKHGWKPMNMKPVILIPFALLCLGLVAALETLAQRTQSNGGLALSDSSSTMTAGVKFAHSYVSTLIAIIFGLAWSWINLDIKRLEPWLQLSRPEGASGRHSLFLEYPYDYVLAVPLYAAENRHWKSCLSGSIMLIILCVITPLQSGIFGTATVNVEHSVQIDYPSRLRDMPSQKDALNGELLNQGYAIAWLNQSYPAYTTSSYSLLPFTSIGNSDRGQGVREFNLTGSTTKYWAELDCERASLTLPGGYGAEMNSGAVRYDNDFGCEAVDYNLPEKGYVFSFTGIEGPGYGMRNLGCPDSLSNHQIAVWAGQPRSDLRGDRDISATLCLARYYKQEVEATVSGLAFVPVNDSIEPLSPPEELLPSEFNITAFESLVGSNRTFEDTDATTTPEWKLTFESSRFDELNVTQPHGELVNTIIGLNGHPLDAYSDPEVLSDAVQASYSAMFSLSIQRLLVESDSDNHTSGRFAVKQYGVVVSRSYSAGTEAVLGLVAVLVIILAWNCHRSPSMLASDPGPLHAFVEIMYKSHEVLESFSGKGNLSTEQLSAEFASKRFKLVCGCHNSSPGTSIRLVEHEDSLQLSTPAASDSDSHSISSGTYIPVTPLSFRRTVGIAVGALLCAAVIVLAVFKQREKDLNGLSNPSLNEGVNSFVTNFIPTAFATLLEPFLVLLNRLLCALQPFNDLNSRRQTRMKASNTLNTRYTTVPPQFTIWNAAKSGHFYLVSICIVALLANVLAVSLSGLFYDMSVAAIEPISFTPIRDPILHEDADLGTHNQASAQSEHRLYANEAFQCITSNITSMTPLLPWTSQGFVFLPLSRTTDGDWEDYIFTATTTGIGVEPSCRAIGPIESTDIPPTLDLSSDATAPHLENCTDSYKPRYLLLNESMSPLEGPSSVDVFGSFHTDYANNACHEPFIVTWSRADLTNGTGTMNSSFVVCSPVIKSATFEVSFNDLGQIDSYRNTTALEPFDLTTRSGDSLSVLSQMNLEINVQIDGWSNTTESESYFNHVLELLADGRVSAGPGTPVPDPNALISPVESLYKLLFATTMGLRFDNFVAAEAAAPIEGTAHTSQTRVFMSDPALIISLAVLGLHIIVMAVLYLGAFKTFLPRLPTSIASLMAYVAASSLVREYAHGIDPDKMLEFGKFVDDDGRAQIGVDYAERVVPVDVAGLRRTSGEAEAKDTRRSRSDSLLGRVWHRKRQGSGSAM